MGMIWIIWKSTSIALHISGTIVYGFAIIYQALKPMNYRNDPRVSMIGDFKYMTYWNLLFQFIFNTLSLVCDLTPEKRLNKRFTKLVDTMFHTLSFPLSIFVCLSFWILCTVDTNLVRNPILVNRYPRWYNHVTHTIIGPINLLELIITYHEEPKSSHGIIILCSLYLLYFFWVLFLGLFLDLWVYPFLEKLNWPQRIVFAIVCGFALVFYSIGSIFCSKLFWSKDRIKSFRRF